MNIAGALIALVALCSACSSSSREAMTPSAVDRSVAGALVRSEHAFQRGQKDGDALAMAFAARERLDILNRLETAGVAIEGAPDEMRLRRLERAIIDATRAMLIDARNAANGDARTIARIDRLFPDQSLAQAGARRYPHKPWQI